MSNLALVTGASSGIGMAYAERLAADGYDLIVVGRRRDRLTELAASLSEVNVQVVVADLATDDGVDSVADICAREPLTMLVNNAGIAHYMPMADLSAQQARELVHVKVVAPTMLTRAALPGMVSRGVGTIINVAGMIAFSGPAPATQMPRRAVYAGTLAHTVAMSQTLSAELEGTGVRVQVVCPGVVATEFHTVQGMDLSAVPRMSAQDVVTASLRGLELGEVVVAPGVEDYSLLEAVFRADLAAFGAQSPALADRYRARPVETYLQTERLALRRFTADDADLLIELDSDPAVMRYLTGGAATAPEEIRESHLPSVIAGYDRWGGDFGLFAAYEQSGGAFVGWFCLRPDREGPREEAELGYRLRQAAWGKGYATEVSQALLHKGFTELGVRLVWADTMLLNSGSRHVMEKVGMTLAATLPTPPDMMAVEGSEQGGVRYEITAEQWTRR